ncbi:GSCOCG00011230001-RA-CDS, partial [Cotesia congregata]
IWGLGKWKFGSDWARRIWLFDRLVWSVMSYGVEIWGWKGREEMERIQERYLRWVLGVSRRVGGYLVREELQRDRLESRAGLRAWSYEKRIEEGGGGLIAWRCRMEMRKRIRAGRGLVGWKAERGGFYEDRGQNLIEVERMWEEGEMREEEWVKMDKRKQEKERWEKNWGSRSNSNYKFVTGPGIPAYIKKGWSEERWSRYARFRLGDCLKGNRYWEDRDNKLCNVCGLELKSCEHVWEVCSGLGVEKGWQEIRVEVLGEDGQGKNWLKSIEMLWGTAGWKK